MATPDDDPLHITRTCPHCGQAEMITHADLVGMMHQMAKAVSARVRSERARSDAAGGQLPGWHSEAVVRAAAQAGFKAARWRSIYSVAWFVVIAMSLFGAGLAFATQQATPALLIVSNLTTATIGFIVWAYVLPMPRPRR